MNKLLFTEELGYHFENESLLDNALTHSSYINENHGPYAGNNERLEFLGDAVFDLLISEYLFRSFPEEEEGFLTRMRAAIVCEGSLAQCSRRLGVGNIITLGRGEEASGGRDRTSILADAMEAVIGAVYLDGGIEAARKVVLRVFEDTIREALAGKRFSDHKTELQEYLQSRGRVDIAYRLERTEGPDHAKIFYTAVLVNGEVRGRGMGRSKKEAEQNAARAALEDGFVL